MKIMKKIAAAALASAALFAFVGCSPDESGVGETEGKKDNATMTVDGTTSASTALEMDYRRYWKRLGSSEKVAEITTEITVDLENSVLNGGASVVGYVFDLNKNESDKSKFDVCVLGFNPQTKNAYVEHYSSIAELKTEDTNNGALGTSDNNIFGGGNGAL